MRPCGAWVLGMAVWWSAAPAAVRPTGEQLERGLAAARSGNCQAALPDLEAVIASDPGRFPRITRLAFASRDWAAWSLRLAASWKL